jgi:hypothetical protein
VRQQQRAPGQGRRPTHPAAPPRRRLMPERRADPSAPDRLVLGTPFMRP